MIFTERTLLSTTYNCNKLHIDFEIFNVYKPTTKFAFTRIYLHKQKIFVRTRQGTRQSTLISKSARKFLINHSLCCLIKRRVSSIMRLTLSSTITKLTCNFQWGDNYQALTKLCASTRRRK